MARHGATAGQRRPDRGRARHRLHAARPGRPSPAALSRDEFEALRLGLGLVASGADQARAAVSLRAKIAAVAPTILAEAGSDSFVFSSAEVARAAPHLGLIRRAIREHLTLALAYRDEAGEDSQRRVRPLQLEFWGKVWTLPAWCELRGDFRIFAST